MAKVELSGITGVPLYSIYSSIARQYWVNDNLKALASLTTMAATGKRPEIIELSRDLRGIPQCGDYERMISGMMYV
jgi:hypothetical protein